MNSSSLNGIEIVVGEIICILSVSRMFVISRLMMMNMM